jgi:SAM-dependent methyltransferase
MAEALDAALAGLRPLLLDQQQLVSAVAAGRRRNTAVRWRRVELRPVELSSGRLLQVTAYDDRQAHTANRAYDGDAATTVDELLSEPFGTWHVKTVEETVQLRVTKKGLAQVHRSAATTAAHRQAHDRAKPHLLDPGDPLFDVIGGGAAKRRQVDAFLRSADAVLDPARLTHRPVRVVDLGCGHAYLTFAAYRWLTGVRNLPVDLIGVDVRAVSRERNTAIAQKLGWSEQVRFVAATIADAPIEAADVVLALHACDTATDEALARAVRWRAPVLLAAPCCHHDLQRQLANGTTPHPYVLATRHGILRERLGDVLTDALRSALLRMLGYRVDVVEFVGSEHTSRNLLLRATFTGTPASAEAVEEYCTLTSDWGVRPALERLLATELATVLPPR